jgi:hypothetical protein
LGRVPALIVEVLAANVAFVAVALTLGEFVLRLLEAAVGGSPRAPSLSRLGTTVLAGFGTIALAGIVLAAVHLFRWQAFVVCGTAIVVLGRRALVEYGRWGSRFVARLPRAGAFVIVAAAVAVIVFAVQWLAALAPPVAYDELAYHLPEAHALADTHTLHLTLGSNRTGTGLYGNLPTLAETLYGIALTIRGAALVHVLHLTMLAAFVLLTAGFVRTLWGTRAAALAVIGLSLYPELVQNAITGYVDAAATAFEAGGAFLLVLWAVRGDRRDAAAGTLLLGFAAGVKYTTLPTLLMAGALVAVLSFRQRTWRLPLTLGAIALVAAGYWYGKNLVRFGNPLYPFAFGHPGITDALYKGWLQSIHQFGHRSARAFVDTPAVFASTPSIAAFLAFVLAPFSLLARGSRKAAALLLVYVLAYTTYWYWYGSSQTRFLTSAVAVAIVLGAAALGAARSRLALVGVIAVALAACVAQEARGRTFNTNVRGALSTWLDSSQARYALGLESTSAYLHHHFSCQVDAVDVLARRRLRGAVALWYLAPTMVYPRDNRVAPIHVDGATPASVREELRRQGFRYAFTQGSPVSQLSPYPVVQQVLSESRPFWRLRDCTLYRLALGSRTAPG